MAGIRLARLPDRSPVKLTISILPELNQWLADYAAFYAEIYGREEAIADLVPAIVASFIEADKAFAKARARLGQHPAKSEIGHD